MAGGIVGVHGDEIIESSRKFEVVDVDGSYLSCQVDSIYSHAADKESPGVLLDVSPSIGGVYSLILSAETFEKMIEWYNKSKK